MKKLLLTTMACAGIAVMQAQGFYQIPNSDFEGNWVTNEITSAMGIGVSHSEDTPASWHSFYNADGDYKDAALSLFADQAGTVKKTAGYDQTGYSATIVSRANMFGSTSNGNLTTGIVHMGSMTADDPENYNYSDMNDPDSCCIFNGLPDSVKVRFRFQPQTATDKASMNMILHTDAGYRDPSTGMTEEAEKAARIAKAYTTIEAGTEWKEYTTAFEYNDNDLYQTYTGTKYLLASFSTNEQAGKGSAGDSLSIDHISLIYNSELADLSYDGTSIFKEGTTAYELLDEAYDEAKLTCTSNGKGATIEKNYDKAMGLLTITVKGNDIEENADNQHVYTVQFRAEDDATTEHTYTDKLVVTINDESTPEQDATINVTQEGNKMDITLPNFALSVSGETMYVGNIHVTDIPLTTGALGSTFEFSQTISIENGDYDVDENGQAINWIGPLLGQVPLEIKGQMTEDKFYAQLDINMSMLNQTIHVTFGNDNFNGIRPTDIDDANAPVNVYNLQGMTVRTGVERAHALDGLQKGIYIVNGKKIIKK